MKEYYHRPHRRPLASLRLLLAAGATLLAACTADDALTGDAATTAGTPVAFTAAVESVALPATSSSAAPHTRTAIGDNGETTWTQGDAVGIFMLNTGTHGASGILPGGENARYTVTPATGKLTPAATPIYYPREGAVDFIAYYPYTAKGTANMADNYFYHLSVADQSHPASLDFLWARTSRVEKSTGEVSLNFGHVLGKIKLNITLGDGLSGLDAGRITATVITGMPTTAEMPLLDYVNDLNAENPADIAALRQPSPSAGADATFTALLVPHPSPDLSGVYANRRIVVTVDGVAYTGEIPNSHDIIGNHLYTYPVTVQKSGITLGTPDITAWDATDHGSADALYIYTLTYDANGATAGTLPAAQAIDGSPVTLPGATALTPPAGKAFVGWSTTPDVAADADADLYHPGDEFPLTRHTTLYAVWGGDGADKDNPIPIYDQQGMAGIANGLTKHYRLMKDIALTDWQPLGADGDHYTANTPFTGTFHGGGHTLTINSIGDDWNGLSWDDYTGIFGEAGPCLIRQLCVAGEIEFGNTNVQDIGGIVGQAADGCVIENCLVRANITTEGSASGDTNLAGILGRGPEAGGPGAIVKNCLVLGNLDNKDYMGNVGGIVGGGRNSAIVNCVVLSRKITINPGNFRYTAPTRIGSSNVWFNNYANRDMSPGAEWQTQGHQWTSKHDGDDGADCPAIPTEAWWKTPGNWKTTDGYTAWDFTDIWEIGTDGYPRLRIIQ